MSQIEIHVGKLKKVELGEQTIEQFCYEKFRETDKDDLPKAYDSFEEWLLSEYYDEFIKANGVLYEILNHKGFDEGDDINQYFPQPDGTIDFVTMFYNGGTCLSEMLEEGLDNLNKR
jgi:hypothetical protein